MEHNCQPWDLWGTRDRGAERLTLSDCVPGAAIIDMREV